MKNFFKKVVETVKSIVQWVKQPQNLKNIMTIASIVAPFFGFEIP